MDPDLKSYDYIVVNSSAGKDSQTMLDYIIRRCDEEGIGRTRLVVAHADLGRMDWKGTRELAEQQAAFYGVRFELISRPQGDLLTHIENRGMWPSSTARYCTSDHKRGQIAKIITALDREVRTDRRQMVRILNCMGLRAEESPTRAKMNPFERNGRLSTRTRIVDTWLPIHHWTEGEVWDSIHRSGAPYHYAYDLGMPRLSCVFCIFAPWPALILAGKYNPELLDEYIGVEIRINHSFRHGFKIAEIKEAIGTGECVGAMSGAWNM